MATVVLTAFAYASTGAIRAMQIARLNQQGADLVTQRIEQVRNQSWGSLGHDPSGLAPDPNLSGQTYGGEQLVMLTGGISPQITTATLNNMLYTLHTYVTVPADASVADTDNRRVTVLAEWAAYGTQHTKEMSTIVTLTQRGLPLPEFKLTQVGPSTITVNPGATAAFGYQLSNQGAPDQWNITTSLAGASVFLDDGDDVYNAASDTLLMTDSNGDGTPDTGRLDPKEAIVFWVVRDVPDGATDGTTNFGVTAEAVSESSGSTVQSSVQSALVVTSEVITATPTPTPSGSASVTPTPSASETPTPSGDLVKCAASNPAPTPASAGGYSVKAYVLHNSGATSWPTFPLPASGTIPGSTALRPMYLDMNPVSIPADRDLPVLSTNLDPANTSGRLLYPGGSFTSTAASQILDFRTQVANRSYTGSMVLRMWARPASTGDPVSLSAQAFKKRTNGNQAESSVSSAVQLSLNPFTCDGWQEVWFSIPVSAFAAGNNYVLGVRVWNQGTATVRLAYDHGAFPATFTVVER